MSAMPSRRIATDVLVIGGGGAALRAAVAAYDAGAKVTLALKGQIGQSGATVAPGAGVAWQSADDCSSPQDSPEVHAANILEAALGVADPQLAGILAREVLARQDELEAWGLRFLPDPSGHHRHYAAYSCFGDQPRAHCIPNTGHGHAGDLVVILSRQVQARGIEVHEGVFVSDLIARDGVCRGALALDAEGETVLYNAGAVVLGTGGARQLYPVAGGEVIDTTGDGYAMALRVGAELTNMAFAQFMLRVAGFDSGAIPGSVWALYPILRNRLGEDVLASYLPQDVDPRRVFRDRTLHYPFSCRDASRWLDIAICEEYRAGRGAPDGGSLSSGGLALDFSQVDLATFMPSRPNHIPEDYARALVVPERGTVRSTAHAINGGVRIDAQGASTLPGLFAAGETATGAHGADRLGGGMVTNCQVFGARAGHYAAELALGCQRGQLSDGDLLLVQARLARQGGARDPEVLIEELQAWTGRHLTVVRDGVGLTALLSRLDELRHGWLPEVNMSRPATRRRAIEAENMLLTAEAMALAALVRRESRGSHYRRDWPQQDDACWRRQITIVAEQDRSLAARPEPFAFG